MFSNLLSCQKTGQIRLLEKQIRPEIIERCLLFFNTIIHQIIYQENIYHPIFVFSSLFKVLFRQIQIYHSVVYQCYDKDISNYINLCIASIKDFLISHLIDLISINILTNDSTPILLRRYLIEFHLIEDPCLRTIYNQSKEIFSNLDQVFTQSIQSIQNIQPLFPHEKSIKKTWNFQFRTNSNEKLTKTISFNEIINEKLIYKEFPLIENEFQFLFNEKQRLISSIKSFHCERIHLQFLLENDQNQQNLFEKIQEKQTKINHKSIDDQTDFDSDSENSFYQDQLIDVDHQNKNSSKQHSKTSKSNRNSSKTQENNSLNINDEENQSLNSSLSSIIYSFENENDEENKSDFDDEDDF